MKTKENNVSAIAQFQKSMRIALGQYHHQALSEGAKRAWQRRKKLSTLQVDM